MLRCNHLHNQRYMLLIVAVRLSQYYQVLFNVLHLFNGMPVSYITAFIAVARHPGEATQYYAKVCGTSDGAMSKVLNALGELALDRTKPGYMLLESRPGFDRRYTLHRLSPSGHALAMRIARIFGTDKRETVR